MRKFGVVVLLSVLFATALQAQSIRVFSGVGLSYDAFLQNSEITKNKAGWPFQPGPQFVVGGTYSKGDGFVLIFDATLGIVSIAMQGDDGGTGVLYQQVQSLVMLGSGPQLLMRNETVLMPYVQLGAGFFDFWSEESASGNYFNIRDANTNRWVIVFGGGVDWRFRLKVPVSLNLRFVYTPLDIFSDPIAYQPATGSEQALQGKLFQTIFTLRFHIPVKKERGTTQYRY